MPSIAYRVDLTERAAGNVRRIYRTINAEDSAQAADWFNGLGKAVSSLDEDPARAPVIPEDASLRHLLHGQKPNVYRIIHAIDERNRVVTVLHVRHGAREAFTPACGG